MTWWAGAVGYEVYLRSFADRNGDGIGDLAGLLSRLEYLAWLGIDLVWVTPFYPSPMHDHGYDVADYRAVEAVFGDLDALDACIAKAHDLGMRLLIDIVPNHTSHEHPWFAASRSSRDAPQRDYYIWRDPAADGGPPNNWTSVFGGPAWTLDEATGQYWLHLFLAEQPDLNWENPAVRDEFDEILRFWLDRGVDGFRIDVAHALLKAPGLPDNPEAHVPDDAEMGSVAADWEALEHVNDINQPAVLDIYRRWRGVVEPYGGVLLGEVYLLEPDHVAPYIAGDDGLHLAFWFQPMHVRWKSLGPSLQEGTDLPAAGVAWVQGSHDRTRAATRYGGGDLGRRRQLAVATLQAGMPGVTFVYQGEELGLEDGQLTLAEAQDPVALHEGDVAKGRDGCRTPMPWEPGPGLGFTTADQPWLPFGGRTAGDTVAVQRDDPDSMLHRYRRLLAARAEHIRGNDAGVEWLDMPADVVAYRRGNVVVAANLGIEATAVSLPPGDMVFTAGEASPELLGGAAAIVLVANVGGTGT